MSRRQSSLLDFVIMDVVRESRRQNPPPTAVSPLLQNWSRQESTPPAGIRFNRRRKGAQIGGRSAAEYRPSPAN
jgi:hypothetical protein